MNRCCALGAAIFVFLCVCLLATGAILAADKITVTDMGKRVVEVPSNAQRIICLGPGTLRLIVCLGAAGKVVGVEKLEKMIPIGRPYILAHPELTKLPTVGPGGPGSINKEPDLEAVLKVKPDVIFVSYMEPANADALQKKLGIPVVILTHGRFASFDELIYGSFARRREGPQGGTEGGRGNLIHRKRSQRPANQDKGGLGS